jgi:hypothetical protein
MPVRFLSDAELASRPRMLAEIGRRSTNQALQRADVDRRPPVLLATLAETYVEVLDELVQLLDQAVAGADSRARHELSQRRLVDRAKAEADRSRLLDEVLDVLADPAIPDEQAGRLVRERIGREGTGFGECTRDGAIWSETEAGQPWTTPGGDFDPTVAAQLTIPLDDGLQEWRDWRITGLVQSWVNGSAPNHGFLLKARDEPLVDFNSAGFSSDDLNNDQSPKLTVTYTDGSVAQGPRVSLATPGAGSTVTGGTVRLAASAEDDRRVDQVDFLVDGAVAGSDTTTPFEMHWNSVTVANGTHNITVRATDDAGNQTTTSTAASVTVDNSALPTGSLCCGDLVGFAHARRRRPKARPQDP